MEQIKKSRTVARIQTQPTSVLKGLDESSYSQPDAQLDYIKKLFKDNEDLKRKLSDFQSNRSDGGRVSGQSDTKRKRSPSRVKLEEANKKLKERLARLSEQDNDRQMKYQYLAKQFQLLQQSLKRRNSLGDKSSEESSDKNELIQHYSNANIALKKRLARNKADIDQKLKELVELSQSEVRLFQRLGVNYTT